MQLASDVAAAIALRAASSWAFDLLMKFNMEQGKSLELVEYGRRQKVCRTLNGVSTCGSQSDKHLGVELSTRVASVEPVESRIDGASETLATLKISKALVRGMELSLATEMHAAFIESKWTYG